MDKKRERGFSRRSFLKWTAAAVAAGAATASGVVLFHFRPHDVTNPDPLPRTTQKLGSWQDLYRQRVPEPPHPGFRPFCQRARQAHHDGLSRPCERPRQSEGVLREHRSQPGRHRSLRRNDPLEPAPRIDQASGFSATILQFKSAILAFSAAVQASPPF